MFKWDGGAESPPNVISPPVTDIVSVGYNLKAVSEPEILVTRKVFSRGSMNCGVENGDCIAREAAACCTTSYLRKKI